MQALNPVWFVSSLAFKRWIQNLDRPLILFLKILRASKGSKLKAIKAGFLFSTKFIIAIMFIIRFFTLVINNYYHKFVYFIALLVKSGVLLLDSGEVNYGCVFDGIPAERARFTPVETKKKLIKVSSMIRFFFERLGLRLSHECVRL